MKKTYFYIFISFLLLTICSCNDDKQEELIEPTIELDKNSISSGTLQQKEIIQLEANGEWTVADVPEWISLDIKSGNTSAEINLTISENREPDGREAVLKFTREKIIKTLAVKQLGLKDVISSPRLPIFYFDKIEYVSNTGDAGGMYNFKTDEMFITPGIKDKIYLGSLVSHNMESNTDIPVFTGYKLNPITVSTSAAVDIYSTTYIPSLAEQEAYAKQIIAKQPKQSVSFQADNGVEFYTHKQLYAIGAGNMGLKLDELVSGSSYKQKEMTKKYGLIFSFKLISFTLNMDIPHIITDEALKEADNAKGVSFVGSLKYGRAGLLIVESDTDSREVKTAVNNVIAGETLSQAETNLINAVDACCVYYTNNGFQTKKGKLDAILKYKDALFNETDNIYPITFHLMDFKKQSINTISYSLTVPE